MEGRVKPRPRVSRETRLLLVTVALAAVALWVLDRVRSLETLHSVVAESAQPLLGPLLSRPAIDELSSDLARLDARLRPWLRPVSLPAGPAATRTAVAVRLRDNLAVAFVEDGGGGETPDEPASFVARDRPTGLTVFRFEGQASPPPLPFWTPDLSTGPRYLLVAEPTTDAVVVRPLLVSGLSVRPAPSWQESVWVLPPGTVARPGSMLFTTAGEFAGAVVEDGGVLSFVPAAMLVAQVDRLMLRAGASPGTLAVEVENLAPAVSNVLGVDRGVVVTWTDPSDASDQLLRSGDVVQALDGVPVRSADEWRARVRRLYAGDEVRLSVVRGGELRDVRVLAAPALRAALADAEWAPGASEAGLGLAMRHLPGVGTSVSEVAAGSRGALAGVHPGDLITRAGDIEAPSPGQLRQAHAKGPVLLSVTRGPRHHVLALQP
jgi:serine protease Do